MTIFGLDVSHHQGTAPDLAQARREGMEFVIIKATEGAGFVDGRFAANLAEARGAGMLVAAYHYVRAADSAVAQVANVRRVVPRDVPVIPDVEAGSGTVPLTRAVVTGLLAAGYRVPLLYLPRWYWQEIGSPSLSGLPPLWSSRYPDTVTRPVGEAFARVPASYWTGYGGLDVAVLQFSSSARVAGYAPLDVNAYRGTRQQLSQLLQGGNEEVDVRDLIIAKKTNDPQVWVGNGVARRPVTGTQLAGLQYWVQKRGGTNVIETIDDLDGVLGPEAAFPAIDLDYNRFVNDVIDGLAAKLELGFVPASRLVD